MYQQGNSHAVYADCYIFYMLIYIPVNGYGHVASGNLTTLFRGQA